jgi:hypothetical protein
MPEVLTNLQLSEEKVGERWNGPCSPYKSPAGSQPLLAQGSIDSDFHLRLAHPHQGRQLAADLMSTTTNRSATTLNAHERAPTINQGSALQQQPKRDVPTLDVCGLKIAVRVTLSRFTASLWIAVRERSL